MTNLTTTGDNDNPDKGRIAASPCIFLLPTNEVTGT